MGPADPAPLAGRRVPAAGETSALSVTRLTLTDFRNYDHLRLETGGAPVVLTGPNGAGKTNILEAISFLVPGRGLRGAALQAVGRRAADGAAGHPWAVAARVDGPDGALDLGTGLLAPSRPGVRDRRAVHVAGEAARSQAVLAEHMSAQWLTPQMDGLFREGPAERRRFLDRIVFTADPAHAGRITAYTHALRERTRLLRAAAEAGRAPDDAWATVLEDTMVTKGMAVTAARADVAHRLADFAALDGPFPGADIGLEGAVEGWLAGGAALDAEDRFRRALAGSRRRDAEVGGAQVGPHKSDLKVRHMGTGRLAEDGSTGEQKALLIGMVLAAARLQREERGRVPVLLLDEVAAHLDPEKRLALYDEIARLGAQAWYTGTDRMLFSGLETGARFFAVEGGRVELIS